MIFPPRGSDGERAGSQSEARSRPSASVRAATMRDAWHRALRRLSAAASGERRRPVADTPDRRVVHALAVPGLSSDDGDAAGRGTDDQSQAYATADAADGDCRPRAEAADDEADARAHHLSVFAARCDGRARQPGLGGRHHLYPDRPRLSLPRRGDGLVKPGGAELAP